MTTAFIFNIQKFCVHDGPGIRTTVFFKGCPLRCQWCHNPESQSFQPQILLNKEKCTGCLRCSLACPEGAITSSPSEEYPSTDSSLCIFCGRCEDRCIQEARNIAGESFTIPQLLTEIEKDRPFYEESGGGVTLSGGEVMSQIDAATALAQACKERGIHVAVDTCGYAPYEHFHRILPYTDLFLYDIKHLDSKKHAESTGHGNELILANLHRLALSDKPVWLRIPLVANYNDQPDYINELAVFIRSLPIKQVNLLPYHTTGKSKGDRLQNPVTASQVFAPPSAERTNEIQDFFSRQGIPTIIGG